MKRFSVILNILISILMILLLVSCKECPTEPKPIEYDLNLNIRFQGCNSIKFNLNCADSTVEKNWVLKRDGQTILSGTLLATDTVITDATVSVDNSYKYQALFYSKSGKMLDSSATIEVDMLPSTSHEFTWRIDTLGYSGQFWDVFAYAEDDVWAVGMYYTDEPDTAHGTDYTWYNAAHWDGNLWKRIKVPVCINDINYIKTLYSVQKFSQEEVYFLSGEKLVLWNGTEYIQKTEVGGVPICLWGRSVNELYVGCSQGRFVSTDGNQITVQFPPFTTLKIREIVGDSNNKLWVTADNIKGDGQFHYFNGNQWQEMWGTDNPFYPFAGPLGAEYLEVDGLAEIDETYILLMVGGNNAMVVTHSQEDFNDYDILFFLDHGWWRALDGNNINDFFGVGNSNLVTHYNGKIFQNYPELSGYSYWEGVDQIGDYVFIVGDRGGAVVVVGKR